MVNRLGGYGAPELYDLSGTKHHTLAATWDEDGLLHAGGSGHPEILTADW
jgi:hypothetical protein